MFRPQGLREMNSLNRIQFSNPFLIEHLVTHVRAITCRLHVIQRHTEVIGFPQLDLAVFLLAR